jgi:hypothetical protein
MISAGGILLLNVFLFILWSVLLNAFVIKTPPNLPLLRGGFLICYPLNVRKNQKEDEKLRCEKIRKKVKAKS